jgi:DNA-binding transcriptional regulator YiaG
MEKKYKSKMLGVLYEDAVAMYEVGGISEDRMREYDNACLAPEVPHVSRSARDVGGRRPSPIALNGK